MVKKVKSKFHSKRPYGAHYGASHKSKGMVGSRCYTALQTYFWVFAFSHSQNLRAGRSRHEKKHEAYENVASPWPAGGKIRKIWPILLAPLAKWARFFGFFRQQARERRRFHILCVFFVPRAPPRRRVGSLRSREAQAKGGSWGAPRAVPGKFALWYSASAVRNSGARASRALRARALRARCARAARVPENARPTR